MRDLVANAKFQLGQGGGSLGAFVLIFAEVCKRPAVAELQSQNGFGIEKSR